MLLACTSATFSFLNDVLLISMVFLRGALKLDVLNERGMSKAVGEFVKKDDKDAIDNMVDHQVKSANVSLNGVCIHHYNLL